MSDSSMGKQPVGDSAATSPPQHQTADVPDFDSAADSAADPDTATPADALDRSQASTAVRSFVPLPRGDTRRTTDIIQPPCTLAAILKQVGPGLIIAANIVGSGELIMTTKTGAQAGIALLWLIMLGCVVKVFVQLELGRFTISHGETTLTSLNRVPGPRLVREGTEWVFRSPKVIGH